MIPRLCAATALAALLVLAVLAAHAWPHVAVGFGLGLPVGYAMGKMG